MIRQAHGATDRNCGEIVIEPVEDVSYALLLVSRETTRIEKFIGCYLPMIIGRCDILTDDSGLDTLLGDEIQRWDNERDIWVTLACNASTAHRFGNRTGVCDPPN
jgi:hypothetical protein